MSRTDSLPMVKYRRALMSTGRTPVEWYGGRANPDRIGYVWRDPARGWMFRPAVSEMRRGRGDYEPLLYLGWPTRAEATVVLAVVMWEAGTAYLQRIEAQGWTVPREAWRLVRPVA